MTYGQAAGAGACAALAMLFLGSNGEGGEQKTEADPVCIYTTQPGDSLWGIADKHTNTPQELVIVYEGLTSQVADPSNISVGQPLDFSEFSDTADCPDG